MAKVMNKNITQLRMHKHATLYRHMLDFFCFTPPKKNKGVIVIVLGQVQ